MKIFGNRLFLYFFLVFLLLLVVGPIRSQKLYTIKGQIESSSEGSPLGYANISIEGLNYGDATDENGNFKLRLPAGDYILLSTYVGYRNQRLPIKLRRDTSITLKLESADKQLREVVVVEERDDSEDPILSAQSSAVRMTQKEIEMVPTIAGENDIIKVVQLLPGVNRGVEGAGDFFVRGGDADQNLLLLDGATIYNTGHLFGFVSVFNPDIIGEANIMRGAFPAYYGGRLSSILDVRTQNTITDQTRGEGSIGLISSKLMLNTPLKKNKVGLMISGRRTYIDQIIDAAQLNFRLPYYFYDLNARLDYSINEKHQLFFSTYLGADILQFEEAPPEREDGETFRSNNDIFNQSQTIGWIYRIKPGFRMNLEVHHSEFEYEIRNSFASENILASSGIRDFGLKWSFQKVIDERNTLFFGYDAIHHSVKPINFTTTGILASIIPSSRSDSKATLENALYIEWSHNLTDRLLMRAGYRQSFGIVDNSIYPGFEPRLAFRYTLNESSSMKFSYTRMSQYLHRVSSASITLPVDLWYTVTDDIKPQSADQLTVGYAWRNKQTGLVLESDLYYKEMYNLTEYEPGTTLLFNADFESALLQGRGQSYGWEVLLRKEGEKLFGWVSYSLGWSFREFDRLNEGQAFNATYDRRHNGAVVLQYNFYRRWAISGVWEYISGSRFTPVIGQYAVINPINTGVDAVSIYSDRNAYTLSASHRLDLMLILMSKKKRRFQGEWRFGVYNVYNRASPIQVYVQIDDSGNYQYVQPGLFGTLPFISYHFKF